MAEENQSPVQNTQPAEPAPQPAALNLEELARKVAVLLLRELSLENERNGKY